MADELRPRRRAAPVTLFSASSASRATSRFRSTSVHRAERTIVLLPGHGVPRNRFFASGAAGAGQAGADHLSTCPKPMTGSQIDVTGSVDRPRRNRPHHRRLPRPRPRHGGPVPEAGMARRRARCEDTVALAPSCTTSRTRPQVGSRSRPSTSASRPRWRLCATGLSGRVARHALRQRRRHERPAGNDRRGDDRRVRARHGDERPEPHARRRSARGSRAPDRD